jgi:hypothetical protein
MKNIFLLSLVILVSMTSCRWEKGSGHIRQETRTVSAFKNIDVSGAIDVYVKQDSSSTVKIDADDNILQYVEVETKGSTLEIYTSGGITLRPTRKIKVYISSPSFEEFRISGASSITSENEINSTNHIVLQISGASEGRLNVSAPLVGVEATGASSATVTGRTKDFKAVASGASKIRGFDLLTENTNVNVSGASHAEVYASVSLNGNASGASQVVYMGKAEDRVDESGASHVRKKE